MANLSEEVGKTDAHALVFGFLELMLTIITIGMINCSMKGWYSGLRACALVLVKVPSGCVIVLQKENDSKRSRLMVSGTLHAF